MISLGRLVFGATRLLNDRIATPRVTPINSPAYLRLAELQLGEGVGGSHSFQREGKLIAYLIFPS